MMIFLGLFHGITEAILILGSMLDDNIPQEKFVISEIIDGFGDLCHLLLFIKRVH